MLINRSSEKVDFLTGGDYIYYKTNLNIFKNVGYVRFLLPMQNDMFGETILVSYSADFYYPELLSDKKHFIWKNKPIEGSIKVKIGTLERLSSLNRLYYFVLGSYILIIAFIFGFLFKSRRWWWEILSKT